MRYMLDTNICSYILKNHPAAVKQKFAEVGPENICLSSIVLAELYYGAARHPKGVVIRREIADKCVVAFHLMDAPVDLMFYTLREKK